jgi:hypothetical protein
VAPTVPTMVPSFLMKVQNSCSIRLMKTAIITIVKRVLLF